MNKLFSKILSVITAASVTLFVSSSSLKTMVNEIRANAADDVVYGDVNGDKQVDVLDLCLMKQELADANNTSIDLNVADVTGDELFNINDVREVQQFLLGQRDSFSINEIKNTIPADTTIVTADQPIETSLTAEMAAKANELGSDIAVYNYLYNNMHTEFYHGSRKGAIGAYEQGGGNDTDLSSLLIAMLRYLGYDANYVTAKAGFTENQLLKWTNTTSIDAAEAIYASQGRFHETSIIDGVTYYICDYKCVQMKKSEKTYYLDICFKEYENQKSLYDTIDSSYSLPDATSIIAKCDIPAFNSEISKYEDIVKKYIGESYSLSSKKIVSKKIDNLSANAPYIIDKNPTISKELTDDESDLVTIFLSNSNDERYKKTFRSAALYKKDICISYKVAFSSIEYAELYNDGAEDKYKIDTSSIFNLPSATAVDNVSLVVTPILLVDGEEVLEGKNLKINDKRNLVILVTTGGKDTLYTEEMTAGEMCSIIFDVGQISSNELSEAYNKALTNTSSINKKNKLTADMSNGILNEDNVYTADYLGSLLRLTGVMYFSQLDISSYTLAERNGINCENLLKFGIVGYKPNVFTGAASQKDQLDGIQKDGKVFVDILSNSVNSISKSNDISKSHSFNFIRGFISSELESSVLEEIFNVESLSTASIFRYAQENNVPIVTLSSDSDIKISDLNIGSDDASRIQKELDDGKTVITLQSNIKIGSWSGIGYIVSSANDTVQEYMISGGYKGGVTFDPVGLYYAINVALDLTFIAESVATIIGILATMSSLAILPIAGLLLAAISIEFFIADIIDQSILYYDYLFEGDKNAGTQIWKHTKETSILTLVTLGVGKGIGVFADAVADARLNGIYGKKVVENAKSFGVDSSGINSKINNLKKSGLTQPIIESLLKNVNCALLDDNYVNELESIINEHPEILNIINAASDKERAIYHLLEFGDDAVNDYLDVGADGIDMLIDNISKKPDDMTNIWKRRATVRGKLIERYVAATEYKTYFYIGDTYNGYYPVIDFQKGTTIVSFKTMNPSSYSNSARISKIEEYAEYLADFSLYNGTDWCKIKKLDIRVPKGTLDMFDKMVITRIENENNITITIGEFE